MNIREPEWDVFDEEGVELPNLETARRVATRGIRELLAADLTNGTPLDLERTIEITDEAGEVLMTVPFSDALKLSVPTN